MFAEPTHILNDRKIDPKKALARGGRDRDPIKKVFVGGLPPELPLEDIKEYFGKFGKVSFINISCCYCNISLDVVASCFYLFYLVLSTFPELFYVRCNPLKEHMDFSVWRPLL